MEIGKKMSTCSMESRFILPMKKIVNWFNGGEWCEIQELRCNQEEADTRMLLHANHAGNNDIKNVVIHTPDMDVERENGKLSNLSSKIKNFYDFFKSSEMNGHFIPKRNVLFVIFMVMKKITTLISSAARSTVQEEGR